MVTLDEKVALLENKLKELLHRYKNLQKAHAEALEEKDLLEKELLFKNEQLKHFQDKLEVANIVGRVGKEGADWDLLRNKIDTYIVQIDQCIGFLDKEL
jgi:chromosome segregation ATPase